jgi:NAD(P)H dehydrogenase (quinone)
MKILIILGHPDKTSFNHAIASSCIEKLKENEHEVKFHDLYAENFDPVIAKDEIPKNGPIDNIIKSHCEDLKSCDGIIIIHPNWWGQPPAIIKGWIDRVFRPGLAYEFIDGDKGEGIPIGLLKAQTALVFNTSNTSREREIGIFNDPLETIWKNCIFDLCGVKQFHRRMFETIITSDIQQRNAWLEQAKDITEQCFPKE